MSYIERIVQITGVGERLFALTSAGTVYSFVKDFENRPGAWLRLPPLATRDGDTVEQRGVLPVLGSFRTLLASNYSGLDGKRAKVVEISHQREIVTLALVDSSGDPFASYQTIAVSFDEFAKSTRAA